LHTMLSTKHVHKLKLGQHPTPPGSLLSQCEDSGMDGCELCEGMPAF
jgi:hypothetical protein